MTKRRIFITLTIVVLILMASCVASYWFIFSGEPYKLAKKLIYESPQVENQLGQITYMRLGFSEYSYTYSGPSGSTEFKIIVTGTKNKGIVFFRLERINGEWRVMSAKLKPENGEFITVK